ncbi:TonB-dependent receptor [Algoriphagus sp. NBT04N3]|uniref:SusC/RagA family TonB-linked outer membrane protein n=1 Tax=Algoriphagus sp. NBT04N3 TaxID=2705473 RepID=UPI001C631DA1|nr:TonB-dependent receptor [Algoriphagus sp. NBT04N3]QYH37566.1 TonB-dependent receptor [Algoriphagus sp. NBT04N3]
MKIKYLNFSLFLLFFVLVSATAFAQITIRGTVTDDIGEPLPGATILVKGTTTGVVTDSDGKYVINAPSSSSVLVFSFIGFDSKEEIIGNRSIIDIKLSQSTSNLEEVVVTGYGEQSKRDITGAVATVDTQDLLSIPATTFAQQLQGRAAGVNIVNDATPGGEATVRIRGFGTIGNNNPLYIIDGVPTERQGNLNPEDIQTIQVLKDASAASIYGSRAANGVVIITTKRGKIGKPTISFNTYQGTQQAANSPEVLNARELGRYLYLADLYAGKTPSHGQYKFGPNGEVTIPDFVFPSGAMAGDPGTDPSLYALEPGNIYAITRSADTYWWEEVTRTAPIRNYQVSATGGTETSKYALSAGYFNQEGIVKFIGYERFSLRANTEFKGLNNRLTIGENLSVTFDNRKGGFGNQEEQNAVSGSYKHHPLLPIYDIAGNFAGSRGANLGNNFNPFAVLSRQQDNRTMRLRVFGNAFASYDINENLQIKTSLGIDGNTLRGRYLGRPQPEYVEGNFINSTTARNEYQYQWVWTNVMSYKKVLNDIHFIDVYVGTEAIREFGEFFQASRQRFAFNSTEILSYLDLGDATTASNSGNVFRDYSLFSQFGKFNYAYGDKYLAQVILRNDASSRFLSASRNALFPAFSVGWRISEENFFSSALPFVNDMKLRYGWGKTGNQAIGDYNAFTTYRSNIFNAGYPIDGSMSSPTIGFDAQRFGNPNAKWETTTSNNLGFDALLFGSKVNLEFDVWSRVTSDMLFTIPITFSAGDAAAPASNVGQITNKGIDLNLGYQNSARGGDLRYGISANFSTYRNRVDRLDENEDTRFFGFSSRVPSVTLTQAGLPLSSYYGFNVLGIFQSQEEANSHPAYGTYNAPGKFKIEDVNQDGRITDDDRTIIGNPHPDFTYGINFNFGYKNWDLTVFGNGSVGNDIFNYVRYFADFNTFQGNRSKAALYDAWQPSNPQAPRSQWVAANPNATAPIMDANDQISSRPSSYFIEDGSYFRVRNIQLTYTMPNQLLSRIGLGSGSIYIQAQNMITITKYSGLNPEIQTNTDNTLGFDGGYMPVSRNLLIGLNVNF